MSASPDKVRNILSLLIKPGYSKLFPDDIIHIQVFQLDRQQNILSLARLSKCSEKFVASGFILLFFTQMQQ